MQLWKEFQVFVFDKLKDLYKRQQAAQQILRDSAQHFNPRELSRSKLSLTVQSLSEPHQYSAVLKDSQQLTAQLKDDLKQQKLLKQLPKRVRYENRGTKESFDWVKPVLHSPNLFKIVIKGPRANRSQFALPNDSQQQIKCKFIQFRERLIRTALQHEFFLLPRLQSRRYLVCIGPGNNPRLIRQLLNKSYFRIQYIKKITSKGNAVIQTDGKKQIIEASDISLLWTQTLHASFLDSQLTKPRFCSSPVSQESKRQICKVLADSKSKGLSQNQFVQLAAKECKSQNVGILKSPFCLHNHMREGRLLGDKKHLYFTLQRHLNDLSKLNSIVPPTYVFQRSISGRFEPIEGLQGNYWIVKPGEESNRGNGILLFKNLQDALNNLQVRSQPSMILQKYLQQPMLFFGRKFDIRCYVLVSCLNGVIKVYWYNNAYVRTSSLPFSLNRRELLVHLTNDAVQARSSHYGEHQRGNKVTLKELSEYMQKELQMQGAWRQSWLQMKEIAKTVFKAFCSRLKRYSAHQFQVGV